MGLLCWNVWMTVQIRSGKNEAAVAVAIAKGQVGSRGKGLKRSDKTRGGRTFYKEDEIVLQNKRSDSLLEGELTAETDLRAAAHSKYLKEEEERVWKENLVIGSLPLPGFGPYPHAVERLDCAVMCEGLQACAYAVWKCNRECHLKGQSAFKLFMKEECAFVYKKGEYTPYKDLSVAATNVSAAFHRVKLTKKSALVVVIRCIQKVPQLDDIVAATKEQDKAGSVQVIIYEQCEQGTKSPKQIGSAEVSSVDLGPLWGISSIVMGHLMAFLPYYEQGLVTSTVFVDADRDSFPVESPRSWAQWGLEEYVDLLSTTPMPLKVGVGLNVVHGKNSKSWTPEDLINTTYNNTEMGELIEESFQLWTRGHRRPEIWPPKGHLRCPSSVSHQPAPLTSASKVAIVTYLSDSSFLVSVRVLLYSMQQSGSQAMMIVATIKKSYSQAQVLLKEFPELRIVEWPYIYPPPNTKEHPRWRDNYSKLNLFNMTEFDAVFYIDGDMIALRNPDEIFRLKLVQKATGSFLGAPDWGFWSQPPATKLNGGTLFVRPYEPLFDCMIELMHATPPDDWGSIEAEQNYLRWFFGDDTTQLPWYFDAQKTVKASIPSLWKRSEIVMLHFVGVKPHKTWSTPEWLRLHREEEVRRALEQQDQIDDEREDYVELSMKWRHFYYSLVNFSGYLTIFAAYHDNASYSILTSWSVLKDFSTLYQPLALTRSLDPNKLETRAWLPEVKNSTRQLQLGEFGSILALANCTTYDKPWIGFTTYSELRKSAWREGLSIDWIKVEESIHNKENRRMAFWYGIYAGNYWELFEHHHAGITKVVTTVLTLMGYDVKTQVKMPINTFWPFGNYFMMPYTLLKEFAAFAKRFIKAFETRYKNDCPFSTMETHTKHW
eukprot:CAMPEP_0206464348 /NCGR_PEP_ID=MMETSP0324_2-20121206/27163_1 /ASSEMBLY_ACC=CAM_ASM_000836 /TAXON_ID=2866 /ORGANISM="Crypthecodinium cohnii, Strain Seligo" /LENGTH=884 /DNA_ID=CAMNT_0053936963 /DNA_START=225 /DNA_END=2876 /DNA_ORIENTATION=+